MGLIWTLWKARWHLFIIEKIHRYYRRKYCHKGYHKLYHGCEGHSGTNQRMKWIHYLKCRHCNFVFFSKPADKKRYLALSAKERSAWLGLLSSTKSKHINSGGSGPAQDASARG